MAVTSEGWQPCPACSADVAWGSRACAGCGSTVAAPALEGHVLTLPRDVDFPTGRCFFCAGRDHVELWPRELTTVPPGTVVGAVLLFLVGGPLGILLSVLIWRRNRQSCLMKIPSCGPCRDRHTTARLAGNAATVAALAAFPVLLGFSGHQFGGEALAFLGVVCGLVAGLVIAFLVQSIWIKRRVVICRRIDDRVVELTVPDPKATREAIWG